MFSSVSLASRDISVKILLREMSETLLPVFSSRIFVAFNRNLLNKVGSELPRFEVSKSNGF